MSMRPLFASRTAVWRQQLDTLKQQADAWWKERTAQERRLLKLGAAVIAAALVWTLGLQPALTTIAQSREQIPRLHADAARVDALILEAQGLQRSQTGAINAAELSGALSASLSRAGLDDGVRVNETVDVAGTALRQWEIDLFNANAERVMEWLADLPYLLQLRIYSVELARANVDGRDRPGHVTGRVVVQLPSEGNKP